MRCLLHPPQPPPIPIPICWSSSPVPSQLKVIPTDVNLFHIDFITGERQGSSFIYLHVGNRFFQQWLLNRLSFCKNFLPSLLIPLLLNFLLACSSVGLLVCSYANPLLFYSSSALFFKDLEHKAPWFLAFVQNCF